MSALFSLRSGSVCISTTRTGVQAPLVSRFHWPRRLSHSTDVKMVSEAAPDHVHVLCGINRGREGDMGKKNIDVQREKETERDGKRDEQRQKRRRKRA